MINAHASMYGTAIRGACKRTSDETRRFRRAHVIVASRVEIVFYYKDRIQTSNETVDFRLKTGLFSSNTTLPVHLLVARLKISKLGRGWLEFEQIKVSRGFDSPSHRRFFGCFLRCVASAETGPVERHHSFQIPCRTDQSPFGLRLAKAVHLQLSKPHLLEDGSSTIHDGLDSLLSDGIGLP